MPKNIQDNKHRFTFELETGETVYLDGIPYEYLGGGRFGGGTDPNSLSRAYEKRRQLERALGGRSIQGGGILDPLRKQQMPDPLKIYGSTQVGTVSGSVTSEDPNGPLFLMGDQREDGVRRERQLLQDLRKIHAEPARLGED